MMVQLMFIGDEEDKACNFDVVIDFSVLNRKIFRDMLIQEITKIYSDYKFDIVLDTDISDQ